MSVPEQAVVGWGTAPDMVRHARGSRARALGWCLAVVPSLAMAQRPSLVVTARPVRDSAGAVAFIDVGWVQRAPRGDSAWRITAPVVYAGVPGIADRVRDLRVRDARGDVPLEVTNDPAARGGFPYFRHWQATRSVMGPVTVTYRALVQPRGERNGPPFGIATSGGGVSGAGMGFLVLPEDGRPHALRFQWNLRDVPPGSIGVSSLGDGAFTLTGTPDRLWEGWYLAGPAGRYPRSGMARGFSAAWLGNVPFDAPAEMAWAAKVYDFLGTAFGTLHPVPRFRVFLRILPAAPCGGGTALEHSFMLSRCEATPDSTGRGEGPRETFVHEMVHQWVGQVEAPVGVSSWFSEGLTTHFTRVLPMRGGFTTIDDFAREVNASARGYYGSVARTWSADSITAVGFGSEDIRHVPYHRGALYFADLDARIRAHSSGTRRLDDLLRELFTRRERGERFDHAAWIAAVTAELGPGEEALWRRVILDGEEIVPASDAFGPCLERRDETYQVAGRPVLGYRWVRAPDVPEAACRRW